MKQFIILIGIMLLVTLVYTGDTGAQSTYKTYDVVKYGAKCDGSTNDTTAVNKAIAAAVAAGGGEVLFPPRTCKANAVLTLGYGVKLKGSGRYNSVLAGFGGSPALQTNGAQYCTFEGIYFLVLDNRTGACVELDGDYDGSNHVGTQGNTFRDCYFDAASRATHAFAVTRTGGGQAQGSENLFINCHFQSALSAGFYSGGANALQNTFVGGNFQSCKYGIDVAYGSVNVYSVGFQNANGGVRAALEAGGWDIRIQESANDHSSIRDCRSESAAFLYVSAYHTVDVVNNNIIAGGINEWAQSTAYSLGTLVKGKTSGNGNGKYYICIGSGTSAASEPSWPATNVAYEANGAITASGTTFTCAGCGSLYSSYLNYGIVVNGAGVAGANLYTTMATYTNDSQWTLGAAAGTTVSGATYRIGAIVTDGTVTWMQYDYNEVYVSGMADFRLNQFGFGRVEIDNGIGTVFSQSFQRNYFTRADWLKGAGINVANSRLTINGNVYYRNGGPNSGGGIGAYAVTTQNGGPAPGTYTSPFAIGGQTLLWNGGAAGTNYAEVGFIPDLANNRVTFSGGKLKLGSSGADVSTILSGTGSLDYAQASANTCETLTLTVTSAADGDTILLGVPNALQSHNSTATFTAWRSAPNTVSVRRCVISADGSNPAAATVRATVIQN